MLEGQFQHWIVVVCLLVKVNSQLVNSQFPSRWYDYDCSQFEQLANFELVGGLNAEAEKYPYLISLQQKLTLENRFNHFCGGVQITKDLILTVAHCIYTVNYFTDDIIYDMRSNKANSGPININYKIYAANNPQCRHAPGNDRRKVIWYWLHPEYSGYSTEGYDIAILQVDSNYYLGNDYPQLGRKNARDLTHGQAIVVGWGATEQIETDALFAASIVKDLQVASVQYTSIKACQLEAASVDEDLEIIGGQMLCFTNPEADTCRGDSGGPLLIANELGQDRILGLTSWGIDLNCSGEGFSGVYTDVSGFIDWIEQVKEAALDPNRSFINHQESYEYDFLRFLAMDGTPIVINDGGSD
eukprot:TRINITY_DN8476_c0_g1_i10.p2 TRINITY_DN8476_c0_g1~~TRINITY_DN8476_c0_g1_i10.p2  ORF type:complete len:357 (-),score=45.29 TRINITY_DN8476_c0_g1_i10:216-1286(-)